MYKVSDECRAILNSPDRTTDFYCQVMDYVIENREYIPSVSEDNVI